MTIIGHTTNKSQIADDLYDPELHGDEQAPPAEYGLAISLTIFIVGLPFAAWAFLDFIGAA